MKPPPGLSTEARTLWRDLVATYSLKLADQPIVDNIARLTDRLTALDRIIRGQGSQWIEFRRDRRDGERVEVYVDRPLAEFRAQALALRALMSELRQAHGAARPASKPTAAAPAQTTEHVEAPSGITSIADRIAAKRSAGAGSP